MRDGVEQLDEPARPEASAAVGWSVALSRQSPSGAGPSSLPPVSSSLGLVGSAVGGRGGSRGFRRRRGRRPPWWRRRLGLDDGRRVALLGRLWGLLGVSHKDGVGSRPPDVGRGDRTSRGSDGWKSAPCGASLRPSRCSTGARTSGRRKAPAADPGARTRRTASRTRSTCWSIVKAVVSSVTASGAARRGESARLSSRASRAARSSRTVVNAVGASSGPLPEKSASRRWARASRSATRKNLTAASGKTTVPMSRPSTTTPPSASRPATRGRRGAAARPSPRGRGRARSRARRPQRPPACGPGRSRPPRRGRPGSGRSRVRAERRGRGAASAAAVSENGRLRSRNARPTARYMAPVSR